MKSSKEIEKYEIEPHLEEEMLTLLKKDEAVLRQIRLFRLSKGEVKANIGPLLDYQEDLSFCQNCPGLASCKKMTPGLRLSLEIDDQRNLRRLYDPCEKELLRRKTALGYLHRDIPLEYDIYSLKNADKSPSRNQVINAMVSALKKGESRFLYIYGKKKLGKTYLLSCFGNDFIHLHEDLGGCVYFGDAEDCFVTLKRLGFKGEKEVESLLYDLKNCPLLLLDDFSSLSLNRYLVEDYLLPILSYRKEKKLLTAFAGKKSIEEFLEANKRGLTPSLREELEAFLKTSCRSFELDGVDFYS